MTACPTAPSGAATELAGWIVNCLPRLNKLAERGCCASTADIAIVGCRLASTAVRSQLSGDRREASILAGDIGMVVSSLLRHGVDRSKPELSELLGCLESLAGSIDHPPRESIYTYVLWNGVGGRSMRTFTGHALESTFIRLTRVSLDHYGDAARLLRNLDLASAGAAIDLGLAKTALDEVCLCYMELLKAFRSQPPDWFRAVYKPYFPAYAVGGILYDPPSGAHGAAIMELDCLLVGNQPAAVAEFEARLAHLLPDDRDRVLHALTRGGIASQLARNPMLPGDVLKSLARVIRSFGRSSALHWALIQKLLVGPKALALTATDSKQVMSYGDVRQLAASRRHPPLLSEVEQRLANT